MFRLSEIYKELGFKNVSGSDNPVKPELRAFYTHIQLMVYQELADSSGDNSNTGVNRPMLRRLIHEASQEVLEGITINFPIKVAIGTMP